MKMMGMGTFWLSELGALRRCMFFMKLCILMMFWLFEYFMLENVWDCSRRWKICATKFIYGWLTTVKVTLCLCFVQCFFTTVFCCVFWVPWSLKKDSIEPTIPISILNIQSTTKKANLKLECFPYYGLKLRGVPKNIRE